MTEKDYDLIAACIGSAFKSAQSDERIAGIQDVRERLELELKLDNPSFDSYKFGSRIQYWQDRAIY